MYARSRYLLLNLHHVASDGWSRTELRRQVLRAYRHAHAAAAGAGDAAESACGREGEVTALSYVDWTLWQRQWLERRGGLEAQLAYWRKELAELEGLELPLDHARSVTLFFFLHAWTVVGPVTSTAGSQS